MSQAEVATLIGSKNRRWYGNLERGEPGNYSDDLLGRVREELELTDAEWSIVYKQTHQGLPPPEERFLTSAEAPPSVDLCTLVEKLQPWPACLCDQRWDVVHYNDAALNGLPWLRSRNNLMEWSLTAQEARRQLADWEEHWALWLISQLRQQADLWPEDSRLQGVVDVALADPTVRRLWDSPGLAAAAQSGQSETRRLLFPRKQGQETEGAFMRLQLAEVSPYRLFVAMPT
ncbi:transcriptional regulator [Streptomyces sp. WAC 06725]|uniref:MmyB family transcriptional regulator n=1 Tax=Streptomyces sp. WAC 06725 TaxID=2203209 RepID=UPI000F7411C3|nr:XRE family transcriptional regulator [Streptomyces sp. WAC 06725]RSO42028.1 transcriptional regulator [Streptomyces sp. WAC 06725]